jgi:hypothetical protein
MDLCEESRRGGGCMCCIAWNGLYIPEIPHLC